MDRVNAILRHPLYGECLMKIEELELDRIFCRHNIEHFLDVARIAYIFSLEEKLSLKKDVIYSAALLHDIGRQKEYQLGIPHEKASADIAEIILRECNFSEGEMALIKEAILGHREYEAQKSMGNKEMNEEQEYLDLNFSYILRKADKMARRCFACKASNECNWSIEKKNTDILY